MELLLRYLTALLTSGLAGVTSGLGNARRSDCDGQQRAVPALLIARRTDGEIVERMVRHLLWVVFALATLPGMAWFVLWLSEGSVQALFRLAAIAVGVVPLLGAARRPHAPAWTRWVCAVLAALPLPPGTRLLVLTPILVAGTGGWLLALALLGYARRRRTKNVVPSN
jgi:hypothetical protein